jgi:hypothetical protein
MAEGGVMHGPCVFLFDLTGIMAEPWANAGHPCLLVDIQHPPGLNYRGNNIWTLQADLRPGFQLPREWPYSARPLAFGAAFCPCDHLAVSGARWFEGKGLRMLAWSIEMFATAAEFFGAAGCSFVIENPVSTISTYWRKSDYTMHPFEFTGYEPSDNYTKKTCLWTGGGFVMPEKFMAEGLGQPDDRIHKCPPGPDRANKRSTTPRGFSLAAHEANRPRIAEAA